MHIHILTYSHSHQYTFHTHPHIHIHTHTHQHESSHAIITTYARTHSSHPIHSVSIKHTHTCTFLLIITLTIISLTFFTILSLKATSCPPISWQFQNVCSPMFYICVSFPGTRRRALLETLTHSCHFSERLNNNFVSITS